MRCVRSLFPLAAFVFGVATATAQEPSAALDATVLAKDLLVPLHTQAADPTGGEYGIWAAGPDYKASFHDGFTFYPVLGPTAPKHLPLAWRTESVAVGEQMLLLGEGVVSWSGVRFERDFGEIVEAYDVRHSGVEQTFTLRRRPAAPGDLVITGAITTPLACEPVAAAHQELVFRSGGDAVIRYGKATAFDADGRACLVSTAWHGGSIRLVLSGSFLAAAKYPVVVDPIISYFTLTSFPSASLPRPVITAEPIFNGKILVAWSRHATSTDLDSYTLAANRDFTGGVLIFTDIQPSWSSIDVDATYVGQASRWVVSQTRSFSSTSSAVRVYVHDVSNTTLNSGVLLAYNAPAGNRDFGPVVGGSRLGGTALVVANRLNTASGLRIIVGVRVDAMTQTLGTEMSFTGQLLEQLQAPRITPMTYSGGGWVVAMVGSSGIRVANVPEVGSGGMPTQLLVPAAGQTLSGLIGLPALHLAGTEGRYLLDYASFTSAPSPIDRISTVRFDWPSSAANPMVVATRTLVSQPGTGLLAVGVGLGGIDYDMGTRSHWVVGYEGAAWAVSRLGYSGGVTETAFTTGPCDVAYALAGFEGSFPLVLSILTPASASIAGSELGYATDAISATYGTSCASGGVSVSTNRSYAGHEFYRVVLNNVAPGTPAIYVLGSAPGSFDLTANGLPGCFLNVALPAIGSLTAVADGTGHALVTFALPDAPLFLGDVFSQWFYFDPAAAPVPFRTLHGVRHQIR